jgi:hypothetical protein
VIRNLLLTAWAGGLCFVALDSSNRIGAAGQTALHVLTFYAAR